MLFLLKEWQGGQGGWKSGLHLSEDLTLVPSSLGPESQLLPHPSKLETPDPVLL